jgi:hypothetical protein
MPREQYLDELERISPDIVAFSATSLMFDYVVMYGLLMSIQVSNGILDKIIEKAKSTYRDMQWVNKTLGKDMFKKK